MKTTGFHLCSKSAKAPEQFIDVILVALEFSLITLNVQFPISEMQIIYKIKIIKVKYDKLFTFFKLNSLFDFI